MWVAGMTFGYGYGFLLVIGAVSIGVSIPYFGGSLFYHKIQVRISASPYYLFIYHHNLPLLGFYTQL